MRTETKYRLLVTFSILCLIGLAGQTVQVWRMNDQLARFLPESEELPPSIEQRLLAELDKKDARLAQRTPPLMASAFAGFNQIQDYMDSLFPGFGTTSGLGSTLFPRGSFGSTVFASSVPEIELDETDKDYRILIPVDPEQEIELHTNIEDNSVSVSGVITQKRQQSQNNFATSFHSQSQFAKTVTLPSPVDEFGMTSRQTEAGIEITIPKKTS